MDRYIDTHDATLKMQQDVSPHRHPESFSAFFSEWIQLLQLHVFPQYVVRFNDHRVNESATIQSFAAASEFVWASLDEVALTELVRQRYIRTHILGQSPDEDTEFVPDKVRSATDYLRSVLGVAPENVIARNEFRSFETGLLPDLSSNPFAIYRRPFSALITLLYQIRCNLFHGVKGFRNRSKRDQLLTELGVRIIRNIIKSLGGIAEIV